MTSLDSVTETTSGGAPAHLEREGDEIRADLGRTIEALEQRFQPRQVMERSLGFLRENGSAVLEEVGTTVRNHPLPLLVTGAGLIWLASSLMSSRGQDGQQPRHLDSAGERRTPSRDGGKIGSGLNTLVREQPLVLGALAVATGALLGAAVPMTAYEDRIAGPLRDQALSKAAQKVREVSKP